MSSMNFIMPSSYRSISIHLIQAVAILLIVGGCDSNHPPSVDIVRYVGDAITPAMNVGWTAEHIDGGVRLILLHEDSTLDQRLVLLNSGADLPAFGGYSNYAPGVETPWTFQEGRIAIQSFDINGEVSGRLDGKMWKKPDSWGGRIASVFWVDLGAESD